MPAPKETFIILPADTSNSGKQIRAVSETISGQTVLSQYVIPRLAVTQTGQYCTSTNTQAVIAGTQNGTSTGTAWLQNPIGSTITVAVRKIFIDVSANAATAAPTAPVISFTKFTFTGTASGSTATVLPYSTGTTANQATLRGAVTGMTVTLVGEIDHFEVPAILTAVGHYGWSKDLLFESPQAFQRGQFLELGPGEGLVVYQSVAGTVSDPRVFGVTLRWMEMDLS